ncbi:MAG: hypothetical protein R2853_07695 [Thermomicrobiales bacterium]|nr:hypothetical protein [Thermomicrobiales bacterium]
MSDATRHYTSQQTARAVESLYMWRGHGIVLLGQYQGEHWVLARGWATADALEDVRRWTFADPGAFAGQVRRLVAEASGDPGVARDERVRALAWVDALTATT